MDDFPTIELKPGARLAPPAFDRDAATSTLPARADVIVVGAGVIGLSIAWRLACEGMSVAVLDRGEAGAGATLSATGMLAAAAEHEPGGEALLPFALESQAMWPEFCAELEGESGVDLDFRRSGILLVALSRDEVERLRARHAFLAQSGLACRWVGAQETRAMEPGLRPSASGGLYCPHDHQVDPRALVAALRTALSRRGVAIAENCDTVRIARAGAGLEGVMVGDRLCRSSRVVVATGAWAARDGLLPDDVRIPVRPVKGQSLALRTRDGASPLSHIVWSEQVHLAPKRGGRLIVGATMEEAGFDAAVTAGGVFALLEGVRRALPCVEEMEIEAIWTGFRPTSDDDAPILGAADASGLALAVGHHRNGILLAPATAQALANLIARGAMSAHASALTLDRFRRKG